MKKSHPCALKIRYLFNKITLWIKFLTTESRVNKLSVALKIKLKSLVLLSKNYLTFSVYFFVKHPVFYFIFGLYIYDIYDSMSNCPFNGSLKIFVKIEENFPVMLVIKESRWCSKIHKLTESLEKVTIFSSFGWLEILKMTSPPPLAEQSWFPKKIILIWQ